MTKRTAKAPELRPFPLSRLKAGGAHIGPKVPATRSRFANAAIRSARRNRIGPDAKKSDPKTAPRVSAATDTVEKIAVVCAVAEQRQSVSTPAPAVANVLDGAGRDREAAARLSGSGINCHGVAAARHEAASREYVTCSPRRTRIKVDTIKSSCR